MATPSEYIRQRVAQRQAELAQEQMAWVQERRARRARRAARGIDALRASGWGGEDLGVAQEAAFRSQLGPAGGAKGRIGGRAGGGGGGG